MNGLMLRLGLALAIGLLVGLERGWRERDSPGHSRTAGIRTYAITALLGGLSAAVSDAAHSTWLLPVSLIAFAVVFSAFKLQEARHDGGFSATGTIAGICVFLLGGMAVVGDTQAAAGAGAALTGLLASRDLLHKLLKRISWIELRAAVLLAVMSAIVLPLLPRRTIDPWGGLNPWEIWFFTVLTAAISYVGYVAVRLFEPRRGLILSTLFGAVVSSTAVTLAVARQAKAGGSPRILAGAAVLAAGVSLVRVGLIVGLVQPSVLPLIAMPGAAALVGFIGGACGLLFVHVAEVRIEQTARSPFELAPLMMFAALFAVVSTGNAALASYMGARSLIASTALSAIVDVDVATISVLRLVGAGTSTMVAANAVLAALAVNGLFRLGLAIAIGSWRFGTIVLLVNIVSVALAGTVYGVFPVA